MTASTYASHVSTRTTPQSQPIPGKQQVANSAGGYSFPVDDWVRLERFLVLGNERGSYYASENTLTLENAGCLDRCLHADYKRTIDTIVSISRDGRAPKNDPAIFALAYAAGFSNPEARRYALGSLQDVCRIGTHLFQFVECVEKFRGWGRGLKRAVGEWYTSKDSDRLAYVVTKYQHRGGWSHRDVLRLAKPTSNDADLNRVMAYATGKPRFSRLDDPLGEGDKLIAAVESAKAATTSKEIVRLIRGAGLVRECVPTQFLNSPEVWEALLENMPMTAMIRSLGKMANVGLLKPMSAATQRVASKLRDQEALGKARVHPFGVLLALSTYSAGRGVKGSLSWNPDRSITEALNDAFYLAFGNVQPTGKRHLLGIDVSGSMTCGSIAGSHLKPRDAAASLAMVTVRSEPLTYSHGFTGQFVDLQLTRQDSLQDVVFKTAHLPFGRTDCSLPMRHALSNGIEVDAFVVLTDNETWCGGIHPCQALEQYRQKTGIPAKLVVVGLVSNGFTIADPNDGGSMDVVGFDAAAPSVMADFIRS